jgi:hypothetical protein
MCIYLACLVTGAYLSSDQVRNVHGLWLETEPIDVHHDPCTCVARTVLRVTCESTMDVQRAECEKSNKQARTPAPFVLSPLLE